MRSSRRWSGRWALRAALALVALSPAGCVEEPLFAEIVLTVDTTFGVPCAVDRLRFEVTGRGETVTRVVEISSPADLPGSFTLLPAGEPGPVSVEVTAFLEDVEVARAVHDTEFVADVSREVRFLLDETCVGEPCDAVAGGPFEELPEPAVRKGCGEDAYRVRETFAVIQNACEIASEGRATVLEEADGQEVRSPFDPGMPFPFRFYGRAVSQFWIGDNGYVGLGDDPPMALVDDIGDPRSLGEEGFSAPGILPFWDKLKTGAAGVCLAVNGVAPYRTLWITWSDACFLEQESQPCGPLEFGRLRFSVGLEESSNAIYMGYLDMGADGGANEDRAHGFSAVIGITDDRPKGCDASECSEAGLCEDGDPCGYTEYSARETLPVLPALEFVPQ